MSPESVTIGIEAYEVLVDKLHELETDELISMFGIDVHELVQAESERQLRGMTIKRAIEVMI
jgi:hypothetical protein